MRAHLIDPFAMKVTEIDATGYQMFRELIGGAINTFRCGPGVRCMVHDRGFMLPDQFFWRFIEHPQGFAGKGLIFGEGADGQMVDLPAEITLDFTMTIVAFLGNELGFERAIQAGLVERPANWFEAMNADGTSIKEKIWEWHPTPKEERQ